MSPSAQDPAMESITTSWQIGLFVGVVITVLGFIVAFHPSTSLNVLCVFIGIAVMLGGLLRIVRSLNADDPHRALNAIAGILMLVIGLILIRHLHLSRLLVALVVGLVFIVQGVVDLMIGFSQERNKGRAGPIILGLVSIVAGIVIIAVHENSLTVLAVLVGIWIIVVGLLQVAVALSLRHVAKQAA